jgi:hypothetical protein
MTRHADILPKVLLAFGFVTLAVSVAVACTAPASGYELSIYTATPTLFWVGIAAGMLIAISVSMFGRTGRIRVLALFLGGGCYTAFVGLPVVRDYQFYGTADALTHLGWARGIISGETELLSLLYPGIHTITAYISETTGYAPARSMLYVVVLFAVLFVIFVPLCAWALTDDLRTTAVATFSAFMLLPITNISSQLVAHTSTQATLFLPVVLYLVVRYLQSERPGIRPTAAGVVLAVALVSLVLYHPQQSLNLLVMFFAIVALQLVLRRYRPTSGALSNARPMYAQTGILAAAFLLWAPGKDRFQTSVSGFISGIREFVSGGSGYAGSAAQRGSSLGELGSGLGEIYLKLFAVTTVYCLVTGLLLLAILAGRMGDEDSSLDSFGRMALVGFVPVTVVFLVYLISDFETQSFRHLGFLVVFATLLGAIGVARGWEWASIWFDRRATGTAVSVAILLGLAVSVAAVFPSPWIYLHSQHVTEMQMSGNIESLDHMPDDSPFYAPRNGPDRYADVRNQGLVENDSRFRPLDEDAMLSDLSETYGTDWYFALSRLSQEREVGAYRGLRYSAVSYNTARSQRGANQVTDNGEFQLYYVTG